jgi:Uma2 family endonuclease
MARPAPREPDEETLEVPASVRFPVELTPPEGFDSARIETWPRVVGRLEWVAGRLLYMPPCGARQAVTVADVVGTLWNWARAHPEFVVGTNEPGLHLEGDTRASDASIWRRSEIGRPTSGFSRSAPVLAVEVAGRDERERQLREKAGWYLRAGAGVVWIVLPEQREVIVVGGAGESRHRVGEQLPADPRLPELTPAVADLFVQVSRGE